MISLLRHTVGVHKRFVFLGISLGVILPITVGFLTAEMGVVMPFALVGLAFGSLFLLFLFRNSFAGVAGLIALAFFGTAVTRDIVTMPVFAFDLFIILTWLAALCVGSSNAGFAFRNDLTILMLCWFIWSILQIANSNASFAGWIREVHASALLPLLLVPLGFLVFTRAKYLDYFLIFIFAFSVLAALNGIKQLHFGPSPGEQQFLDEGGHITHVLFGRLRVFSFYSDAGQFGASQAQMALMALILAFGPFRIWKRVLLLIAAALLLYGMLISGTRGALFALLVGGAVAVALWGNVRVIIVGSFLLVSFFCFLKFTYIGNGNYAIYRLRSAVNPEDPSLNLRFRTQNELNSYMKSHPFGAGLGTIGYLGTTYNPGTYMASVQPDSYWVKVWAMYGNVGFTLWFCMVLFILGRCCGIVWTTKDKGLHIKLLALTAGYGGILFCSYGNEVMNTQPSFAVMLMSWSLIYLGPKFDNEIAANKKKVTC